MINTQRIINKLDEFLNKNDYASAEKHILYWLDEAKRIEDKRTMLLVSNELCGLYRKLQRETDALSAVKNTLELVEDMGIVSNIGAATTYINAGTVLKAFGKAEQALPLFEKALTIYNKELSKNDSRFGGLYNNMSLVLVDLKQYKEASELYNKAIDIMKNNDGMLEVAITYLNIANLKEAELGLENAQKDIEELLDKAKSILEQHNNRNGYYAFVCQKCASVFGYYGYFLYENELRERAEKIYERS